MSKTIPGGNQIKVDKTTKDGICFVCGRTPEEIDDIFDVPGLKSEIINKLAKEKRPASDFDPITFKPARTRFDTTTLTRPFDLHGQTLRTSRSFPHYDIQYHREGTESPLEPSEVIEVTYHLPICPFCSKLLDDASKAAYKTIHAQEYCEDD